MTTDSPSTVGSVATRTSSMRPAAAAFSEMRPSCGFRRSAMSSFASTFRRVVTPAVIRFGMRCISWSTPSTRKRTTSESSCGSKWMSEAPSSAAWKMTELTRRTSGASETPSSASRSVGPPPRARLELRRPRRARRARRTPPSCGRACGSRRGCRRATRRRARADGGSRAAARRCRGGSPGSATATVSVSPSSAYGIATTRSSTCSGISVAASWSTPRRARGRRAAAGGAPRAIRAMPSLEATPSSTSACASEPVCRARPRASASLSRRDEPRGGEQVDDELGDRVDRARATLRARRAARVGPGLRSAGMSVSCSLTAAAVVADVTS